MDQPTSREDSLMVREEGRTYNYGTLQIPAFEFDDDMVLEEYDSNPAPFLTPDHKRWSVLEKLNRNHICQIRNCHDFCRMFNGKCVFSTFMLIAFASLSVLLTRAIFFNTFLLVPSYDFIVVGGGTAGCIITRSLVDAGARVLLLEAGAATQFQLGGASHYGARLTNFDIPLLWSVGALLPLYSWKSAPGQGDGDRGEVPLGKGLGGTGVFSSMLYLRATPADIASWNMSEWSWERMLAAYRSLEAFAPRPSANPADYPYRGLHGPISVEEVGYQDQLAPEFVSAAVHSGLPLSADFNDPSLPRQGAGHYQFTIRDGVRVSTATAYLAPVLHDKDLTLQLEATASAILLNTFDSSNLLQQLQMDADIPTPTAYGVDYMQGGVVKRALLAHRPAVGQKRDFEGKRCIILTAGAIMTPKLLLASGVGDPEVLDKAGIVTKVDNRQVGKMLRDHMMVTAMYPATPALAASYAPMYGLAEQWGGYLSAVDELASTVVAGNQTAQQAARDRLGILSSPGFSAGAFLISPFAANASTPDIQLIAHPATSMTSAQQQKIRERYGSIYSAISISVILLNPESSKDVLAGSSEALDAMPLLSTTDEPISDQDAWKLAWGVQQVRKIMKTPPLAKLAGPELSPGSGLADNELTDWVKREAQCAGHWVGSMRMGNDPLTSAVDPSLKVRGVDGLKVADASVIPSLPSGDIQATVQAVAALASEMFLS